MVTWAITPYQGAGDLHLDMTVDAIRGVLGDQVLSVRIHKEAPFPSDVYGPKGIVVSYDQHGTVEAIEFSGPDQPTYHDKQLVGLTLDEAEQWMSRADEDAQIDPPDLTSLKLGIALYAPLGKVEAVMIFRRGYYRENP